MIRGGRINIMKIFTLATVVSFAFFGLTACGGSSTETENLKKELETLKKEKENQNVNKQKDDIQKQADQLTNQKQKLEGDKKKVEDNATGALGKINRGMPYDDARSIIMKGGWQQVRSYTESINSVTDGIKDKYFEVILCEPVPDMPCSFEFKGPNNKTLVVNTTGEMDHIVASWVVK